MDKIVKALSLLSRKEQQWVRDILKKISRHDTQGLDIKKLKGRNDIFRVRKAQIRVIYRMTKKESIYILAVERRSDTTYGRRTMY